MKKIVRLTESDMVRLIRKVISEQDTPISPTPSDNTQAAVNKPMKNEKYYNLPYKPNVCETRLMDSGIKVPKEGYYPKDLFNSIDKFTVFMKKVIQMKNNAKNQKEWDDIQKYLICTIFSRGGQ